MPDDLLRMLEEMDQSATKAPWRLARSTYTHWSGAEREIIDVEPLDLLDNETGESLLEHGDAAMLVALRNSLHLWIDVLRAADGLAIALETVLNLTGESRRLSHQDAYDAARARFAQAIKEGKG